MNSDLSKIRAELRLLGYQASDYSLNFTLEEGRLIELDLAFNKPAEVLPTSIFRSLDLLILRLRNFHNLPEEIGNMQQLILLSVTRLFAEELPYSIWTLSGLQILILSRCHLTSIEGIHQLSSLIDLDLIFNHILQVPSSLSRLEHLHSLSLGGFDTSAAELGTILRSLPKLVNLTLAPFNCPIFPEIWFDLCSLTGLHKLTIGGFPQKGTELSTVPALINNLTNLEHLWIDGNITCFPDIPGLSLKSLNLFGTIIGEEQDRIIRTKQGVCRSDDCPIHR